VVDRIDLPRRAVVWIPPTTLRPVSTPYRNAVSIVVLDDLIDRRPAPPLRQLRQFARVRHNRLLVLRLPFVVLRLLPLGCHLRQFRFLPAAAAFGEDAREEHRSGFVTPTLGPSKFGLGRHQPS